MYILHECVALSTSQNYIVEDVDEDPRWRLIVSKLITAEDLENNHYLEILGDVLEQIDLPVNFPLSFSSLNFIDFSSLTDEEKE